MDVLIENTWKTALQPTFSQPYFKQLVQFLKNEKAAGVTIYPSGKNIFNAFSLTPFDQVRVVILGQDPYHNPGQAHGLSFSVPSGIKPPPSLNNIYKEIQQSLKISMPSHFGDLTAWAEQGVLMLNAILTVRANEPASHSKSGWQLFTDEVIRSISNQKQGIIFLLWGKFAQEKSSLIDGNKHHILKAAHPSPFSADKGFFGCNHFVRVNEILMAQGDAPINWAISDNSTI
ncbi:MAG: uracil-DNA glycosylase [Bacteroidota bacterium]|jgi:uracil-DNA glycosylase